MSADLTALVKKHWDIKAIAKELKAERWHITEGPTKDGGARIDRMVFLTSYGSIENMAKESLTEQEIEEYEKDDSLPEVLDDLATDYMETLADSVKDVMKDHVYGTFEEGDAFVGQYEDGDIENLREKFDIDES